MNLEKLSNYISNNNIKILGFREHNKASEKYVNVIFSYENEESVEVSIPYQYRRTGLFIDNEQELAKYLEKIYPFFTKESKNKFIKKEIKRWNDDHANKKVTKLFFDKLINLKLNSVENDLPSNPNFARRIQDIKELGYTIATYPNKSSSKTSKGTCLMLLPIPKGNITGYETISEKLKNRILSVLKQINVYENKVIQGNSLIPDHKFSEIRWDENTKSNLSNLTDIDIINKFQLLDNQRNLQKREVCRKCFNTNKRGIIFGISFYYEGNENWDINIPKVGKEAEKGCVGCAWYDIEKWRDSLNKKLSK